MNDKEAELWLIWDSKDGFSAVIPAADYVQFCRKLTDRDFWGFTVTTVEFGRFSDVAPELELYDLNLQVEKVIKADELEKEGCNK